MTDSLNDLQRWIKVEGILYLKELGIKKGQVVVDFGSNTGHYTLPAAKIVGPQGRVYAIEREQKAIDQLMKSAKMEALANIIPVCSDKPLINLAAASVDVILIYDVLHYLNPTERKNLYQSTNTALKEGGILTVFPKHNKADLPMWHLEKLSVSDIVEEIENSNFRRLEQSKKRILHDEILVDGIIIDFKKN